MKVLLFSLALIAIFVQSQSLLNAKEAKVVEKRKEAKKVEKEEKTEKKSKKHNRGNNSTGKPNFKSLFSLFFTRNFSNKKSIIGVKYAYFHQRKASHEKIPLSRTMKLCKK